MNNTTSARGKSIVLLGASFATGNLGVNALAWSSLKIIRAKWPEARIVLVGTGRQPGVAITRLDGRQEKLSTWPVRYCLNLLERHHIVGLGLAVFLCRLLPLFKKRLARMSSTLGELLLCDLVCDITGGDSFSDIYGFPRLFRGYLLKRVCQMSGKPFIMLPQTYGPFKTPLARILARRILIRTEMIYSRDQEGIAVVEKLIGKSSKLKLCPDVAFAMEATRPDTAQTVHLEQLKAESGLIGLNISGLLYNGGYTQNNMFGLACNYQALVTNIVSYFIQHTGHHILLVPHVLPSAEYAVEDDLVASLDVLKSLPAAAQMRITVLEKGYDQNETKYCIGLCTFFLGARMHATIAALSQCIPAVGMAYSKKFAGVFATAGVENCVLDLRQLNEEQVLDGVRQIFNRKEGIRAGLEKTLPEMKHNILNLFNGFNGKAKNIHDQQ